MRDQRVLNCLLIGSIKIAEANHWVKVKAGFPGRTGREGDGERTGIRTRLWRG